MTDVSKRFKALANENRLAIFAFLRGSEGCCGFEEQPPTVGDVAEQFDLALSTVSHHLKVLRDADLICCEPNGQQICCVINKDALEELRGFFASEEQDEENGQQQ
jgi:ArsR family transcriptional regulator